jgi:hypothetical protein
MGTSKSGAAQHHAATHACASERRRDHGNASVDCATGRIDPQRVAIPSLIFTADHRLPIRQGETRHLAFPGFHAAPVLFDVRADRLALDDPCAGLDGDVTPGVA